MLNQTSLRRPYFPGHGSSYLQLIPEEREEEEDVDSEFSDGELKKFANLTDIMDPSQPNPKRASMNSLDQSAAAREQDAKQRAAATPSDYLTAGGSSYDGFTTPGTPGLSRSTSATDISSNFDSGDFPPVDRLTVFDLLENLALPQRLEKMQQAVHVQAEKVRKQRQKLASRALSSKNTVVDEWRKRVNVKPEEQLDKYRRRMRDSVDRLGKRWTDAKTVTLKEKISFVSAVLNIFISAYMIGAFPEYFHYWYTVQLLYVKLTLSFLLGIC